MSTAHKTKDENVSGLTTNSPFAGFMQAVSKWPDRCALDMAGATWTYTGLSREAGRIAAAIKQFDTVPNGGPNLVAIAASRSLTAYAGTLAVFATARAHVAINPAHPVERSASILKMSEVRTIVAGNEALEHLDTLLANSKQPYTIIAPETPDTSALQIAHPNCIFLDADTIAAMAPDLTAPNPQEEDLAYLVFTSGSTGVPKGVSITHGNLAVYMRNFRALAAPIETDRVAQTFELTFDVALHDMFNAWWSGAALYVMPARALMAPAHFIREQKITYWFSVASAAMLMQRQRVLKPGAFPDLRVSLLCGEALPAGSAEAWSKATPNAALYNVYGPTETTMEMSFYLWSDAASPAECRRGITPIGVPFDDHRALLLDEDGATVIGAGRGEFYLSGPQVGPGYWMDDVRTASHFVRLPERDGLWYRTGDVVERDETGMYHFVGRVDNQIKLRGNRIELGDIEAAMRTASGSDMVAVVPHPVVDGQAQGLIGFVASERKLDRAELLADLRQRLPKAMIPDRVERIDAMPLNANRKIDRNALIAQMGQDA